MQIQVIELENAKNILGFPILISVLFFSDDGFNEL